LAIRAVGGAPRLGGASLAALGWAGAISILLSTKFLAQPFVWRNWPLDQVFGGWLRVLLDRVIVAAAIALAVAVGIRLSQGAPERRAHLLALAILVGASTGEGLRIAIDPFAASSDPASAVSHIVQWTLICAAVVGVQACWRLQADSAASAAISAAAEARARRALLNFQLETLQRQIEPHFLFNTLATIRELGQTSPEKGLPLLERLFDYTSQVFAVSERGDCLLGQELDLALAYLDVCAARMSSRLFVVTEIEAGARAARIPSLVLGTLVENAIKHGVGPKPGQGRITLRARLLEQTLLIEVEDDGVGLRSDGGAGTGLWNLKSRLKLVYGDRASLELRPCRPSGVCARLRVPYAPAG
jgi:signal transduction histidine kinase